MPFAAPSMPCERRSTPFNLADQRHSADNMNLNQVTLPSKNVERSAAFYRLLGFRQIVSDLPRYARFECLDGSATFSLHEVTSPAASEVIVYFECDHLDAECARLRALGVAFEAPPKDQSWLWREAYLRDPDGNLICLYHAGVNRRFPPWRIADPDQ
jgi:catechol 2,3-dioxygenase-like lactoylglutathione lyase family enzyme